MQLVCRRYATTHGRMILVPTGVNKAKQTIPEGVELLDNHIRETPGEVIVLGLSQGAAIASQWLHKYGYTRPNPARLRFILLASPVRGAAHGGKDVDTINANPVLPTPTDTGYTVWDVARRGDKFAAPEGGIRPVHSNYFRVDLDRLEQDALAIERVGETTFYTVP